MPLAHVYISLCQTHDAAGPSKPTEWIYSRRNFFIPTECVILYFFNEICNFFINFVGVSIVQSRDAHPPPPPQLSTRGAVGSQSNVYPTFCFFRFRCIMLLHIMLLHIMLFYTLS